MNGKIRQEYNSAIEEREIEAFFAKVKWAAVFFFVFITVCMIWGSFFTTAEYQRTVVLRWGKFDHVAEPGLNFKIPLITTAIPIDIGNRTTVVDAMSAGSADQQEAKMRVSVNWKVNPLKVGEFYTLYRSRENAETAFVLPAINARTKVIFGRYTAATTFSNRAKLNDEAAQEARAYLGEMFILDGLQIENVSFNDKYEDAIEARMLAEVEVAKERQRLDREKVLADIANTQAKAVAFEVEVKGAAEAKAIRAKGDAEAASIKAKTEALSASPHLVALTWAEKSQGQVPQTVIMGQTGTLPFLPIGPMPPK